MPVPGLSRVHEDIYGDQNEVRNQRNDIVNTLCLPKIELPVFDGDPVQFPQFISAFDNTVHSVETSDAAKLARLLMYCSGRARRTIEACTVMPPRQGYERARQLLYERYGDRFKISEAWIKRTVQGEQLKASDAVGLLDFADDLSSCQATLDSLGLLAEIDTQRSIVNIVGKLPAYLQSRWRKKATADRSYHGWYPDFPELVDFVRTAAVEVNDPVFGSNTSTLEKTDVSKHRATPARRSKGTTFYTKEGGQEGGARSEGRNSKRADEIICPVCTMPHQVWACEDFKKLPVRSRWDIAKKNRLCFQCLGGKHLKRNCERRRLCSVDGCSRDHHRLLHLVTRSPNNGTQSTAEPHGEASPTGPTRNSASQQTYTAIEHCVQPETVAMRTVAVTLSHGDRQLRVNVLLDEASTRTYVNSAVAAELGLQGEYEELKVSTLNNSSNTLKTTSVTFTLTSDDKRVKADIVAYTVDDVTGKLPVVNWQECKRRWPHLRNKHFPEISRRTRVDLLLGMDYAELMCSQGDVKGGPGEPIARKTPLGWTCLMSPTDTRNGSSVSHFTMFLECSDEEQVTLERTLRHYWDIDDYQTAPPMVKVADKEAVNQLQSSIVK